VKPQNVQSNQRLSNLGFFSFTTWIYHTLGGSEVKLNVFAVTGVLASLVISTAAQAVPIAGAGTLSCGRVTQEHLQKNIFTKDQILAWVQGFQAAANLAREGSHQPTKAPADVASTNAYVDKYCHENPLKTVFDAAVQMSMDLPG
jgi:hypothetical protein